MIVVKANEPDADDDPENRYDCDHCAYAPLPTETIVLVLDKKFEVVAKLCEGCAEKVLTNAAEWGE